MIKKPVNAAYVINIWKSQGVNETFNEELTLGTWEC